jgi:hypothetical protein
MTEQEQIDLDKAKAEVQKIQDNTFDYLRSLNRANKHELEISGYRNKTNAEAMQMAFNNAQKRIEKIWQDHVRKYPD